jgi:hypothetical protein
MRHQAHLTTAGITCSCLSSSSNGLVFYDDDDDDVEDNAWNVNMTSTSPRGKSSRPVEAVDVDAVADAVNERGLFDEILPHRARVGVKIHA